MNGIPNQRTKTRLAAILIGIGVLVGAARSATGQEQTIHERMFHSRAVEAVVWAMPLLNFKGNRDAHALVGVGYNDIAYHSRIQDGKFQTATPNNTTPYVNCYWSIKDGPMADALRSVRKPESHPGIPALNTPTFLPKENLQW